MIQQLIECVFLAGRGPNNLLMNNNVDKVLFSIVSCGLFSSSSNNNKSKMNEWCFFLYGSEIHDMRILLHIMQFAHSHGCHWFDQKQ
mgnify:CR=1 FL=1